MALTQAERIFEVKSPLGDNVLLFRGMNASEHLNQPFEFELELLSEDCNINFKDVLGQTLTVRFDLPNNGGVRYFNGHVSEFSFEGTVGRFASYRANLRPWLWLLTRTADCRIFQELTVPEIVKKVFRDTGFTDFDDRLTGSYRTWEYCVQYRESDFNFVSRLMEQEGIYYYFLHEDGKHTLVLSDSVSAHDPISGYENVPYFPPEEGAHRERDHISYWKIAEQLQSGKYELTDFDFEKPRANLQTRISRPQGHSHDDQEIYDYPGTYLETGDGDRYVAIRLEEIQSQQLLALGNGDAGGLYTGGLFNLTGYPRDDQNHEYLLVSSMLDLRSDAYMSGETGLADTTCHVSITAIDSKTPYRAARVTPKPVVQGPQTAIVVGKSGEEIWTDKHGRVKVQFHWDREGKNDENSSCWVRVSQPWAGKGWGAVAIPRIGQEVIVDFLEGDPDRPIITGRVYNGEATPPYGLPAQAMLSGVMSDSTKGGGGYNEIVMDDSKGNELIRMHGQFDMDTTIENDLREHVLNNRSRDVAVDETVSVGNNQTSTIGVNQGITVGSNQTVMVGSNKAETIAIAKALTIGAAYQVSVGAGMNETIGGAKAEEIGGAKVVAVGGVSTEQIGVDKSVDASGNISESAGGSYSMDSGSTMNLHAGEDFTARTDANGMVDAADQLVLKCGSASITLKKNGDITIDGKTITVKGSGDVIIKGKKILQN